MSLFFQFKSSYWRLRAEETRVPADTMTTNLHAYGVMLRIAEDYERLADIADRENAHNARFRPCPRPRDRAPRFLRCGRAIKPGRKLHPHQAHETLPVHLLRLE